MKLLNILTKIILGVSFLVGIFLLFAILDASTQNQPKKVVGSNLPKQEDKSLEKSGYKVSQLDLNSRIVYIYGEINESTAPIAAQEILKLTSSAEPIYILINSPGGSVLDGAMIISAIEAAKGPVNTICIELCASMAAMIHQYGTNRLVLNRSFLMFHPASGGVEGEVDKSFSRLSSMRRFIGKMEENVALRSKLSYDDYKRKSGVELWLDAEDALNNKFAD